MPTFLPDEEQKYLETLLTMTFGKVNTLYKCYLGTAAECTESAGRLFQSVYYPGEFRVPCTKHLQHYLDNLSHDWKEIQL